MGGFGAGIGAFMEGYQRTMAQRHSQREAQFHNLMNLADQHRQVAERQRQIIEQEKAKPVFDEGSQRTIDNATTIMNEAATNAHKATMDAEKALNEKIGGLTKLGGLLKGFVGRGAGGGAQGTSGAPAGGGTPQFQAADHGPPGPPLTSDLPNRSSNASSESADALPAPPGASATGPQATAPNQMPAGFSINPSYSIMQNLEEQRLRRASKVQTDMKIEEANEIAKNEHKRLGEEYDQQHAPALRAAGVKERDIALGRVEYLSAGKVKMPGVGGGKIVQAKNPTTGADGKDYYLRWQQNAYGDLTELEPIPAGKTAAMRNMSARYEQQVNVYKKAHPDASDEEADSAVATAQSTVLQNKAKMSNLQMQREEQIIEAGKNEAQWKKEAHDLKTKGGMTGAQALATMRHFDAMAQFQLFGDPIARARLTTGKTAEEVVEMVLERSKALLQASGFDRDTLMKLSTGSTGPTVDEQTANAKQSLVTPPAAGPARKSGTIAP